MSLNWSNCVPRSPTSLASQFRSFVAQDLCSPVLPFDMKMCTLIRMLEDLAAQGTRCAGRQSQVESGRAEFISSLFPLPSCALLSEVLFLFWCSLSLLTFLPVLWKISISKSKISEAAAKVPEEVQCRNHQIKVGFGQGAPRPTHE